MTQEIRQKIIDLAHKLPDELLPEALASLNYIAEKAENLDSKHQDLLNNKLPEEIYKTPSDNSSNSNQPEFDKVLSAYQIISKKYKNALRELAK